MILVLIGDVVRERTKELAMTVHRAPEDEEFCTCSWFDGPNFGRAVFSLSDLESALPGGQTPAVMPEVQIGGVVRLKSGGPEMTVVSAPEDETFCRCSWSTPTGAKREETFDRHEIDLVLTEE